MFGSLNFSILFSLETKIISLHSQILLTTNTSYEVGMNLDSQMREAQNKRKVLGLLVLAYANVWRSLLY